jgi:spermidine/putrescine transport system substrate-binding protein
MLTKWTAIAEPERRSGAAPLLRRVFVSIAVLAGTLGLAACGSEGGGLEGGSSSDAEVQTAEGGEPSGELTISNWPLYIDKATVPNFEQESGVETKYIEDINDNTEFFGKLRPQLAQGESGGRSIIMPTDWMAAKMYDLGYILNLDKSAIPNVTENLIPSLQSPSFDPERNFSVPWQSGMTGVIVRKDLAPDITSINDLFDPKYKGKVTMLSEMRDTVPLVMKADGIDPADATDQDWLDAIEKIEQAAASGQIRDFTGNDYADDLTRGDVVAAIGWSGDAVQLQADNPNIEWRMPDEGCMLWTDNMLIPIGAPNTAAALAFMDYVYDPEVAADITEYVQYITPVDGVKEIFEKRDPDLAKNQLIFPDEQFTADCTIQVSPEDDETVTEAFESVLAG